LFHRGEWFHAKLARRQRRNDFCHEDAKAQSDTKDVIKFQRIIFIAPLSLRFSPFGGLRGLGVACLPVGRGVRCFIS